jgi:hypothetical protein
LALWSVARFDLRLDEFCFWSSTLREIHALAERKREADRLLFLPNAMLCALYANSHRDPARKPRAFSVDDFMPGEPRLKQQSVADMMLMARSLNELYGGTFVKKNG